MTHGSLFSGIGGFDLAAEWMGWDNVFHCEWNEFGQRVLHHYWPQAIQYNDITKTDFTIHRGRIDVLTGGFPCQPYSAAGKRLGKEDERHLWPEMLRAIRECQPTWVVGENVRGLVNWNGGMVFDEVQADMEAEGYEVLPFLVPACGKDAPHRRERIWFVAYSESARTGKHIRRVRCLSNGFSEWKEGPTPDTECCNIQNKWHDRRSLGEKSNRWQTEGLKYGNIPGNWDTFPTVKPTICSRNDGLSGKLDGITFPKWRSESIKAYGNAVVPQVVYEIFKSIEQYDRTRL